MGFVGIKSNMGCIEGQVLECDVDGKAAFWWDTGFFDRFGKHDYARVFAEVVGPR